MAREFPADVVRTTDRFAAELGQVNGINVDDIARLWRAYTTQQTVVQDVVVSRLENFFWRIWSNVALQQNLTGITLATLFMAIHENSSLHIDAHRHQSLSEIQPPSVIMAEASLTITTNPQSDEQKESPKKESKNPLPPILKKSTEGKKSQPPTAPSSFKTTRIVVPEKQTQKATKDTAVENGKATAITAQKPARKKAAFVANRATSSRRRGVLIRRKSTQTSPVQSPAVERSEESLEEEFIMPKDEQVEETAQKSESFSVPKGPEFSWRSLSYLKVDENKTAPPPPEHKATGSGTSPPPTNFSLSSVRHHRSPESVQASYQETTRSVAKSNKPLVDQDFRTHFVQRKRQESAHGTNNNSTASSLTTSLSSTNFRELLNAAQAAAQSLPNHDGPSASTVTMVTSTRKPDGKDRSRRPMIINTQLDIESVPHQPTVAVKVSESSTSTSQQTTSGVFSVPKESQGQLGEQLNSLIKGAKRKNKN
ncbi:hypothetical protein UA08_03835 [Talaromyces atroroseus]|uniref:Nitrogen regulatory protein areA GATA-like domain-containing protein n=1 Tax=Talaromyces atroroseus TaxID=1441469 RepID=A0A225AHW8_TALAT|nr:hypothetical protein UA08_03835 [Talaromyces atroroseus]OKL61031.1 hypothetical protein UA08_03835 [Talaromyces atroroseus]